MSGRLRNRRTDSTNLVAIGLHRKALSVASSRTMTYITENSTVMQHILITVLST